MQLPSSTIVTRRRRAVLTWILTLVLGLLALSVLVVVLLCWVNPPTSAVMLQHGIAAHFRSPIQRLHIRVGRVLLVASGVVAGCTTSAPILPGQRPSSIQTPPTQPAPDHPSPTPPKCGCSTTP